MAHCARVFLTTIVFLFTIPALASSPHYTIIVDAGSSGSRAYVFEYTKNAPIPIINSLYSKSTTPGLSSYAADPAAAGPSLQPILTAAADFLQTRGVTLSTVPVSILATAGMRSLPLDEQQAIYTNVRHFIRSNYAFSLHDDDVQTITGKEEGVYGWLDVNYLLNNFTPSATTVGSLDMGGASTQIAFATTDTSHPDDEITITLNHTTYRIFSQSFLGLGQNQALNTMTTHADSSSCFPTGYPYGSQIGHFNSATCGGIYTEIIQNNNAAERIIPTTDQQFIAYSSFFYNFSFFNTSQTPTQNALQSQINTVCYLSWDTLQLTYPDTPPQYLAKFCANGVYFNDLLYNTYHLQDSQLRVIDNIKGTGIEWPLGALLYHLVS